METRYEDEIQNSDVKNHEPITFGSPQEMLNYLRLAGDLYSPQSRLYVFGYNDAGAIAAYVISEEEAKDLSHKMKEKAEDWSAFLEGGGLIYDAPDEYGDENFAYIFCKDWYTLEWYDTIDYAALVLGEEAESETENENSNQREVVEICSHCEAEVSLNWNVETQGYVATCPECGHHMMLCDECLHADDNECQRCDWHEHNGISICFRGAYDPTCINRRNWYFTFGSDSRFPHQNCYLIVKAPTEVEAIAKFRSKYPDRCENTVNCAFWYSEESWERQRCGDICGPLVEIIE